MREYSVKVLETTIHSAIKEKKKMTFPIDLGTSTEQQETNNDKDEEWRL